MIFICILGLLPFGRLLCQGGVFNPSVPNEFTVAECYRKSALKSKPDTVRPNSILLGQRVWRIISLENAQNSEILNTNNQCLQVGLFEVLKYGIFEKKLNVFSSSDFSKVSKTKLSEAEVLKIISHTNVSARTSFDENGNSASMETAEARYLMGNDIRSYVTMEDWFINSTTSKAETRVLAIAPVYFDEGSQQLKVLFWIYFPEWKSLLASFYAKNFYSYAEITYFDIFSKHYFISTVSMNSNVFERDIKSTAHGRDSYLESESVKEKINTMERDLFEY